MVLEDGIISPSEDQLLWSLRQELGIDDAYHVQMVVSIYGDQTLKSVQPVQVWPNYMLSMVHGIVILAKNGVNNKYTSQATIL